MKQIFTICKGCASPREVKPLHLRKMFTGINFGNKPRGFLLHAMETIVTATTREVEELCGQVKQQRKSEKALNICKDEAFIYYVAEFAAWKAV